MKEQNRLLLERIELLSDPTRLVTPREPAPTPEPTPAPGEPAPTPAPAPAAPAPAPEPAKPVDFVGSKPLDDIVDKAEGLNEVLNRVMNEAGTRNVEVVVERILRAIPNLVAGQIVQQNTINEMVKDFYGANKDLVPAKRTVGIFVNEVHSEHPDWKTEDVFKEAGTRTRKTLGLRAQTVTPPAKPAFVKQRGSHRRGGEEPKLEGMAKEIDELITD